MMSDNWFGKYIANLDIEQGRQLITLSEQISALLPKDDFDLAFGALKLAYICLEEKEAEQHADQDEEEEDA